MLGYRRYSALALLSLLSAACIPTPIQPAAPRPGTSSAASFSRSWEAAIDLFAERNIQIKTLDRSSGLIVAEAQKVGPTTGDLADCGKTLGTALLPTDATWNLLVRGDSSRSTIKANVRFVRVGMARGFSTATVAEECASKGTWETIFESQVKERAETKK